MMPLEVIYQIFSYLDYPSLINTCQTNREFQGICNEPTFWEYLIRQHTNTFGPNMGVKELSRYYRNLLGENKCYIIRISKIHDSANFDQAVVKFIDLPGLIQVDAIKDKFAVCLNRQGEVYEWSDDKVIKLNLPPIYKIVQEHYLGKENNIYVYDYSGELNVIETKGRVDLLVHNYSQGAIFYTVKGMLHIVKYTSTESRVNYQDVTNDYPSLTNKEVLNFGETGSVTIRYKNDGWFQVKLNPLSVEQIPDTESVAQRTNFYQLTTKGNLESRGKLVRRRVMQIIPPIRSQFQGRNSSRSQILSITDDGELYMEGELNMRANREIPTPLINQFCSYASMFEQMTYGYNDYIPLSYYSICVLVNERKIFTEALVKLD